MHLRDVSPKRSVLASSVLTPAVWREKSAASAWHATSAHQPNDRGWTPMTVHTGRHFLQIPGPTNVPDRVLRAMD
ncbi:MAG: hypothetical protein E6614_22950, partial [Bradyrhizobium sp.]|nr:hypothetical protein [Bradyrhizobium sp.]